MTSPDVPTKIVIDAETGESREVELSPEEIAQREADAAAAALATRGQAQDTAAGDEQLTLIQERAADDPAYAALARAVGVI